MALQRQPLAYNLAIVTPAGLPTPEFQRQWQSLTSAAAAVQPDTYVRKGQFPGWASASGTASRSTFSTFAPATASAAYSQAQQQLVIDMLVIVTQHLKALIDDLKSAQLLTP